jgi:hypothetical protein
MLSLALVVIIIGGLISWATMQLGLLVHDTFFGITTYGFWNDVFVHFVWLTSDSMAVTFTFVFVFVLIPLIVHLFKTNHPMLALIDMTEDN